MRGTLTKHIGIFADLHVNSTVGLCPKGAYSDDGQPISLSKSQLWLDEKWGQCEEIVRDRVGDEEYIFIGNGDLCDIDEKDRSSQYLTDNATTAKRLARMAINNQVRLADSIYILRGTSAHVGSSADLEESIAEELHLSGLPVIQNPDTKAFSWWVLKLMIDNVRLLIAHHPPSRGGSRPANRNNVADRIAFDTFFSHIENGEQPPDLVVCSHLHTCRDSYDHYKTRAVITPSFQLATEYVYRLGITDIADIGFIMLHIDDGKFEVEKFLFKPEENKWQEYLSPEKKLSKNSTRSTTKNGLLKRASSLLKRQ